MSDQEREPYNPLDKRNLGESIAMALLRAPPRPLKDTTGLVGCGVYALYYTGEFAAYLPLRERNVEDRFEEPIHVGNGEPGGGRKGKAKTKKGAGKETGLRTRLGIHRRSIEAVGDMTGDLKIEDFYYRALPVDDAWIRVGESARIERFRPLWNVVVDGFGNNPQGSGRKDQERSLWDTLHSGRKVAKELPDNSASESDSRSMIAEFLRNERGLVSVEVKGGR